jgi:hypothetical protein
MQNGWCSCINRLDSLSPAVISSNSVLKCTTVLPRCQGLASIRADTLLGEHYTNAW